MSAARKKHAVVEPLPRVLGVIPARWGSTRFPGKPLHPIAGRALIHHVWEQCRKCRQLDAVVVATDDDRIAAAVRDFGGEVVMTRDDHASGTDRIAEVARKRPDFGIIINIQGDEPLISPALIGRLARDLVKNPVLPMITAANPLEPGAPEVVDPNVVKVTRNSTLSECRSGHDEPLSSMARSTCWTTGPRPTSTWALRAVHQGKLSKLNNLTVGQVYESVIRRSAVATTSATVQVIPHVTNEIKSRIREARRRCRRVSSPRSAAPRATSRGCRFSRRCASSPSRSGTGTWSSSTSRSCPSSRQPGS
jgi:CTP:molybdopterin cytidylyltransferase MocA